MTGVAQYLSPRVREAFFAVSGATKTSVCEIRIRRELPLCFSVYGGTVFVNRNMQMCKISSALRCTGEDVEYTVNRLCSGSLYRYADSLKRGYIVTPEGIRAGIYGEAVYEDGRISVVDGFCGINVRVPHRVRSIGERLCACYFGDGPCPVLIFSPPGVGKTTLIREAAVILSQKYRISVIDEKGEIFPENTARECGMCDVLKGYTKPDGMEIAVRTLAPELIICDEIGMREDIPAILSVQNSGVPLMATAHGDSIEAIMKKPNIRCLCENGVFKRYVRMFAGGGGADMKEEFISEKAFENKERMKL